MSDLKARRGHCAGALVLSSRLTEVIIFGGCVYHKDIAATIVLRFGKLWCYKIVMCYYIPLLVCLALLSYFKLSVYERKVHFFIRMLLFPTIQVNGLSCSDSWNKMPHVSA